MSERPTAENDARKPRHVIVRDPHGERGPVVWCICGWAKSHPREKVREAAVVRHLTRVTSPESTA